MIRPLLFGIAILIAGATQATAQGLPSFKIVQGCREVSSGQNKLTTFDECMEDEKSARDDLTKSWETFVASDRRVCLEETTSDGTLSYVELLECLNIVRDTRGQMRWRTALTRIIEMIRTSMCCFQPRDAVKICERRRDVTELILLTHLDPLNVHWKSFSFAITYN